MGRIGLEEAIGVVLIRSMVHDLCELVLRVAYGFLHLDGIISGIPLGLMPGEDRIQMCIQLLMLHASELIFGNLVLFVGRSLLARMSLLVLLRYLQTMLLWLSCVSNTYLFEILEVVCRGGRETHATLLVVESLLSRICRSLVYLKCRRCRLLAYMGPLLTKHLRVLVGQH